VGRRDRAVTFVCLYQGVPGDCSECGGFDPTGTGFCCHDCAQARADRAARHAAAAQASRDREDAFAREVDRLRAEGYRDEEIDLMLAGMPS
jgi:hypothetical protein